jgi:hypothetical protein
MRRLSWVSASVHATLIRGNSVRPRKGPIKLNLSKKDFAGGVPAMLLHLLYEAAQMKGLPVEPTGVECLQTSSGSKIAGPKKGGTLSIHARWGKRPVCYAFCFVTLSASPFLLLHQNRLSHSLSASHSTSLQRLFYGLLQYRSAHFLRNIKHPAACISQVLHQRSIVSTLGC